MDFAKLKERQKKSKEVAYIIDADTAGDQIFSLLGHYNIDVNYELDVFLDDEKMKAEMDQMTDDEKKAAVGMKQIITDVEHWIRQGVISIEKENGELVIKHALLSPVGIKSDSSQPIKDFLYGQVKPKHTEKMSSLKEDKFTFSQRAELLMSFLSGVNINIFNKLEMMDKRAARDIGILLLTAL